MPKPAYHHGDLRAALIEAAVDLIAERGLEALSLREVARRVGVTHQAPYRHFADKQALVVAVAELGFERLQAHLGAAREAAGDDAVARLDAIGAGYVRFAVAHPALFRVMTGAQVADKDELPTLKAKATSSAALLTQAVLEAQAAGAMRPVDALEVALLCRVLAHGLADLVLDDQLPRNLREVEPGALLIRLASHLRAGLAAADVRAT